MLDFRDDVASDKTKSQLKSRFLHNWYSIYDSLAARMNELPQNLFVTNVTLVGCIYVIRSVFYFLIPVIIMSSRKF